MHSLRQDLLLALRLFRRSPLFTGVIVVTMAIAIGLNTAVFSAIESLLLRPLPGAAHTERLVQIYRTRPGVEWGSHSIPHYLDVRERTSAVLDELAYWTFSAWSVTQGDRPQRLMGQVVSANFFSTLGAQPAEGRFFLPEEDVGRGAHPVIVLSHAGRRIIFGSDLPVVGRSVHINGHALEVVGVAAPEFRGAMPVIEPVGWVPLMQLGLISAERARAFDARGNNFGNVVARMRAGVSPEQVNAALTATNEELRRLFPDEYDQSGMRMILQSEAGIHPSFRSAQVGMSTVILGVVLVLLLVACVNVSNLMLARARDRAREIAIRLSLGATRQRLVRQLLVESLVISVVSGAAGLLVATVAIRLANAISLPIAVGARLDLRLNPVVLGFAALITLLSGILFGLVPALQATHPSLVPALKGDAVSGGNRSRVRSRLLVAQMALSIILLTCSGLFLANLRTATTIDVGFTVPGGTTASVAPGLQGYDRARSEQFYGQLFTRLLATPGIQAVGMANALPLGIGSSDREIEVPGYTPADGEGMSVHYGIISPDYFAAMGTALLRGREFTPQDDSAAVRTLIVNQRFAQRFWPDGEALGRTVRIGGIERTIVGVVPTGKYLSLGEPPRAFMYFPQAQSWTANMQIVVRGGLDQYRQLAVIREQVAELDPQMPVVNLLTLEQHMGTSLMPARVAGGALGLFGLLGLLLASVGIYGVMAYSVGQRTREIGIRLALGSTPTGIVGLILRQGLRPVLLGCVLGLLGAGGAFVLIRSVLYGVGGLSFATFLIAPTSLLAVATAALLLPALQASRLDPQTALRHE